ncbi:MAG: hypothetical protein NTV86_21600 [Planctomycetota bacterium]|nr:hypothetical protein [Planctomycetota bacterium]
MTQAVTVLKKAVVREAPGVPLGGPSRTAPSPAPAGSAQTLRPGPAGEPQARILEQNETAAMVEVLCPCGCRIVLRCQTGSPPPAGERIDPVVSKERVP